MRRDRGIDVLAQVDALRLQVRVELLEAGDLLRERVAAVVDDDVHVRRLVIARPPDEAEDDFKDRIGGEYAPQARNCLIMSEERRDV